MNISKKRIWLILLLFLLTNALYAETTVYITSTGSKYHRGSCSYLKKSKIPISLVNALARGYGPCGRCRPPTQVQAPESKPVPVVTARPSGSESLAFPYCSDPARIQRNAGFALLYSEEHEQPSWVAYLLTDDEARSTVDPEIPSAAASG